MFSGTQRKYTLFEPTRVTTRFSPCHNDHGFYLIEIAIVLVIIGILAGGGTSLLGMLTERKARNEALDYLKKAREALITYADINGRLPWADTDGDGCENPDASAGNLPYWTLGIAPTDSYKRVLRYEFNTALGSDRSTTCDALRSGLTGYPLMVDADGTTTVFRVAAVLVSAGPMDADSDGNAFDDISGAYQGDNRDGRPNYIRHPPVEGFDDLVTYISSNELCGDICEYLVLAVNKDNKPPSMVYIYDVTRDVELGKLGNGASASYDIISGTRIEIRDASGDIVHSTPKTPIVLAGSGCTINVGRNTSGEGGTEGGRKDGPKIKPLPPLSKLKSFQ